MEGVEGKIAQKDVRGAFLFPHALLCANGADVPLELRFDTVREGERREQPRPRRVLL